MKVDQSRKRVWIVGASSGIGLAIAKLYSKESIELVLSSRHIEQRKNAFEGAKANIHFIPFDLENPADCDRAVATTLEVVGSIDEVIFSAGKIAFDEAWKMTPAMERSIFEVNYWGPVNICRSLIPHMISRQQGRLVFVGSVSGTVASPLRSAYGASKHALRGYVMSTRAELEQYDIQVSLIDPGFVDSGIDSRSYDGVGDLRETPDLNRLAGLDVDDCARQILTGIEKNKAELTVGGSELTILSLQRYFPTLVRKLLPAFRPSFASLPGTLVSLPSGTTHCRIHGTGKIKVLFTNGITSSFDVWDDVINYFDPEKYQVLLYNYYGRGGSVSASASEHIELCDFDEQLGEILTHMGWSLEEVHFVSYSWGCGWLARYLEQLPSTPKSLVMLAPAYWNKAKLRQLDSMRFSKVGQWAFSLLGKWLLYVDYLKHAKRAYIANSFWKKISTYVGAPGFIDQFQLTISQDIEHWPRYIQSLASQYDRKILAIAGSSDIKSYGAALEEFKGQTGICNAIEIQNLNHLLPLENGLLVSNLIQEHVERHE